MVVDHPTSDFYLYFFIFYFGIHYLVTWRNLKIQTSGWVHVFFPQRCSATGFYSRHGPDRIVKITSHDILMSDHPTDCQSELEMSSNAGACRSAPHFLCLFYESRIFPFKEIQNVKRHAWHSVRAAEPCWSSENTPAHKSGFLSGALFITSLFSFCNI